MELRRSEKQVRKYQMRSVPRVNRKYVITSSIDKEKLLIIRATHAPLHNFCAALRATVKHRHNQIGLQAAQSVEVCTVDNNVLLWCPRSKI